MKQLYLYLLVLTSCQAQTPFTTNEDAVGYFGRAYAINGNDIFASSATNNQALTPAPGRVYYFSKQSGTVTEQQVFESGTGSLTDMFGGGLSAKDNYLAVAATAYNQFGESGTGKVYIFVKNAGLYELFQTVSAPDENTGDAFGIPYFYGDDLFVSAIADEVNGAPENTDSGSVYRFHFDGTYWEFAQKLEVADTFNFGREIKMDSDRMVISSDGQDGVKRLHTFSKIANDWVFQGTTNLSIEENNGYYGYHGFDLSEGFLYILRDVISDLPGLNSEVVVMALNSGIWEESSTFGIDTGDEFYARIEIEGDKLFMFDIHQYILAMGRKWPIHYFRKINDGWQYQTSFFSEFPGGDDDFFGRTMASDSGAMVLKGEPNFVGPFTGKSYLIDFATLSVEQNQTSELVIYPNPSSSFVTIHNPNRLAFQNIKVISVTGTVLMKQSGQIETLDVSSLSSGIYFLQLQLQDGTTATKRFVRS